MIRYTLLFSILLASVCFVGCTEDTLSHADDLKVFMQIYIPRAGVESRTVGIPTTPGTEEENAISDITIYLDNGAKIIKIENISMSQTPDTYISDLIPIEETIHNQELKVFIVANPQKAGLILRDTRDFKEMYSTQADTYKLVTLGQMVMSNQVEQSPAPTIVVTRENIKENPAKVHVYLDRLAVKIVPQVSVNFRTNFYTTSQESTFFADFTFDVNAAGLLNAATEFNLEQQWSDGTNGQPIQLLSPTLYYKPESPYFSRFYNTINEYANVATAPFVPINENAENGYRKISSPLYCLENNPPFYDYTGSGVSPEHQVKTKHKGLTTGVIFRIQAIKDNVISDFYRYEGIFYSDTPADRTALAAAANLSAGDFDNIATLRSKGIKVYEDGNIYYTYWMKENDPVYGGEGYDLNYAVLRNSSYLLKVNGLSLIGDDIPGGGYEPDEPIDKVEQITIVAVCQDWALYDVTHDFN